MQKSGPWDINPLPFKTPQVGTCKGDSGGPAITRKFYDGSFHYTVLGVVSGNPRPLNCGSLPDFYTYVGHEKVSENSSLNSHFIHMWPQ